MRQVLTYMLLFSFCTVFSQKKDNHLRKGNDEFEKGNFAEAEANYRAAHSKNPGNSSAYYNLGNSVYKQGAGNEAKIAYSKAIDVAKNKGERHQAYRNLGNVHMKEKDYQGAVNAYENALRNNPGDEETRYNYALAKKMLKDNPPPNPPPPLEGKDKDKNKDRRKSNKNNENDSPKGKGSQKDMAGEGGDIKREQPSPGNEKEGKAGMGDRDEMPASQNPSEQRAKNILDAVNNEEKKVMDRINRKRAQGSPVKHEKDW